MGRPKKSAEARRSHQIIFRLNDEEFDRLEATAQRAGMPANELARRLSCRGAKRLLIRTYRRMDPAFLKRLDQIGNNLNQVVKSAHIFGRIPSGLQQLCETIDRIVTQAIEEDSVDGS